jgi:hypothetical protein
MRLSTALTPRVIGCAEDLPQHIALPRGLWPELEVLLRRHGVALDVDDKREHGTSVSYGFQGALTDVQKKATRAPSWRMRSVHSSRRRASARPWSGRTWSRSVAAAR